MMLLYCFIFLLCFPTWSYAHISGYTDTSIQITSSGIRIIYTLPSDHVKELNVGLSIEPNKIEAADRYLSAIRDGWEISSADERCLLTQAKAKELNNLPSYQYQLTYVCPQGINQLKFQYHLFFNSWSEHENFVRIFMADQRQRLRFTSEQQELLLSVEQLLQQWNKTLTDGFLEGDPNRGLKSAIEGHETELSKIEQTTASLGEINLSLIDSGFIKLGFNHIFQGLDHMLFVIGLVLTTTSLRKLMVLVTAFTLAHTSTLALSTLGLINFSASVSEPMIAITIIYIGLESVWVIRKGSRSANPENTVALIRRVVLVFVFGLIHGVGFSYILREMGMREELLGSLLYFNAGVELGQLGIIMLTLPVVFFWQRLKMGQLVSTCAGSAIACAGLVMFISRI